MKQNIGELSGGGFKSPPPLLEQEGIFRRTHKETTRTGFNENAETS